MRKKVIVGMSGGVDSAVTAYLLKEKGYDVIGCSILMHDNNDFSDVKNITNALNIPLKIIDNKLRFKTFVEDYFFDTYKNGMTPNPCVECNKFVKFRSLFDVMKNERADFIATGHYAKNINGKLIVAKDKIKDQSYFLYNIPQEYFKYILFPLGDYFKQEVKEISKKFSTLLSKQDESQDICFLKRDYKKYMPHSPGRIIDDNGKFLAAHNGIFNYTIGQRKGLGIAHSEPLFVKSIDSLNNEVVVSEKCNAVAKFFEISDINILDKGCLTAYCMDGWKFKIQNASIKIRYASHYKTGDVYLSEDLSCGFVAFKDFELGIAPGQSAVFYMNDQVILGGKISKVHYPKNFI